MKPGSPYVNFLNAVLTGGCSPVGICCSFLSVYFDYFNS